MSLSEELIWRGFRHNHKFDTATLASGIRLTRCLSPLAEVISYALGWIAVIPIIPADIGVRTSIALLCSFRAKTKIRVFHVGFFVPLNADVTVRCFGFDEV